MCGNRGRISSLPFIFRSKYLLLIRCSKCSNCSLIMDNEHENEQIHRRLNWEGIRFFTYPAGLSRRNTKENYQAGLLIKTVMGTAIKR